MATRTKPPVDLATLQAADDATFWELAAKYGYVRPSEIDPDQAWFWTREWVPGHMEDDWDYAEGRFTTEKYLCAMTHVPTRSAAARRRTSRR
jgi:hypothetical protein